MVRRDMKGTGLGYRLMQELLNYARDSGIQQLYADILRENHAMRQMADEFGFVTQSVKDETDTVTLVLKL